VLDIMLPDGSGLDFLRELRETHKGLNSDIPVLLLTALSEYDDVVKGLQIGGDDYLAKPFNNKVLLARMESLLRRSKRVPKIITKDSLVIDIVSGRAFLNGTDGDEGNQKKDLLLAQKEFAILLLLVQNEGAKMSADFIYESVWKQPLGDNINTLKMTISNLRKKIEASDYTINALYGEGYIFEKI